MTHYTIKQAGKARNLDRTTVIARRKHLVKRGILQKGEPLTEEALEIIRLTQEKRTNPRIPWDSTMDEVLAERNAAKQAETAAALAALEAQKKAANNKVLKITLLRNIIGGDNSVEARAVHTLSEILEERYDKAQEGLAVICDCFREAGYKDFALGVRTTVEAYFQAMAFGLEHEVENL